jgi:hypothetical protein
MTWTPPGLSSGDRGERAAPLPAAQNSAVPAFLTGLSQLTGDGHVALIRGRRSSASAQSGEFDLEQTSG